MSSKLQIPWDLGHLQIFLQVVEEGSLTRVAAATGSPQPSISRKISKLEEACGGRLFLRTGRGVSLSELGERLLPSMQAVVRETSRLTSEVLPGGSLPAGEVRIGTLPSLCLSVIVPLLELQLLRFPKIVMHVQEGSAGQIDQWLSNGVVDIGMTYRYGRRVSADADRLLRVGSFLIGPPGDGLTQANTIEFRKLDGLPLVLPSAPSAVRLLLDRLARRAHIHLNVVMEADSTQIQKAAASRAGVYTVMPAHAVADELLTGSLQAARIVEPQIDRDIALGTTSARPASHASREVAKLIRSLMTGEQAQRLMGVPP